MTIKHGQFAAPSETVSVPSGEQLTIPVADFGFLDRFSGRDEALCLRLSTEMGGRALRLADVTLPDSSPQAIPRIYGRGGNLLTLQRQRHGETFVVNHTTLGERLADGGVAPVLGIGFTQTFAGGSGIAEKDFFVRNVSPGNILVDRPQQQRHNLYPPSSDNGKISEFRLTVEAKAKKGEDASFSSSDRRFFGVCDGMGGHAGGARAAELSAKWLTELYEGARFDSEEAFLRAAINRVSDMIHQTEGAGKTTAAVAMVATSQTRRDGIDLVWANVGDSRIYVIREGCAAQVTTDDGEGHLVSAFLGGDRKGRELVRKQHQIGRTPLYPGDAVIVVSDGITGDRTIDRVTDAEIAQVVGDNNTDPRLIAQKIMGIARKSDDRTIVAASFV